jgi:type VI secretion system protein ImpJ
VNWQTGQFLYPHHLQAAERHAADQRVRSLAAVASHPWGLNHLEWQFDAAADGMFHVVKLSALLPDGSLLEVPGDGPLASLDIPCELNLEDAGTVLVGVPLYQPDRKNLSEAEPATRYRLEILPLAEENTGDNAIEVGVRRLNARLFTGTKAPNGYAVLKVARFRAEPPGGPVQLDPGFIPPLLRCGAWAPLGRRLAELRQAVRQRLQDLDRHLAENPRAADADPYFPCLFPALHEGYAVLSGPSADPDLSPFALYAELARLLGRWTVFRPTTAIPEVPRYQHDDLGSCLGSLFEKLTACLPDLHRRSSAADADRPAVQVVF